MNVREFEQVLFERFPRQDAETCDHVGLAVGDPQAPVRGVSVALDATAQTIRQAAQMGSNVLLTHHPVYIKAPESFTPEGATNPIGSAVVYQAARLGVSVISLHTNLDRSRTARELLPGILGMNAASSLEYPAEPEKTGLGAVCDVEPIRVRDLAKRCAISFGTHPRVWGDHDQTLTRIAFLGGSLGSFGEDALSAGCDCVVTGEAGYHACLDLACRGAAIILLGHDRSEEPFVDILARAAIEVGVEPRLVHKIEGSKHWYTVCDDREGARS